MSDVIWERQPGEHKRAYSFFCTYREMGITRSIRKVAEKYERSVLYMQKLSSNFNWVKRAAAYDKELEEIAILENIEGIRKMNQQFIETAQAVRYVAGKKLSAIYEKIKSCNKDNGAIEAILKEIPVSILPSLLQTSFEIERRCRGVSDKVETENKTTVTIKSTEEIEQKFNALLRKGTCETKPATE